MRTCPVQPLTLSLWMKPRWILDSLWRHVRKHHKRGRACCQDGSLSWGVSFPSLPSLEDRSGVVGFRSVVEPLFWVELELVFFCFECEEPLPDLLSELLELDFCSDLFPEDPDAQVSWETSPHHSQYHASMACMSFLRPDNIFGLLRWTMSSLICLASPL